MLLAVLFFVYCIGASSFETSSMLVVPITDKICSLKQIDLSKSIDGAAQYNAAYAWTGRGSLWDWKFRNTQAQNAMQCAESSYATSLLVPHFFEKYFGAVNVNLKIQKSTCANSTYFSDVAIVTPPVLIEQVRTHTEMKVSGNDVHVRTKVKLDLPWYLDFLHSKIGQHVMTKCQQKIFFLLPEICH